MQEKITNIYPEEGVRMVILLGHKVNYFALGILVYFSNVFRIFVRAHYPPLEKLCARSHFERSEGETK